MNKKKIIVGVLLGAVAGVLDVVPMVVQDMPWDANLSAFSHWVIVGFFIAAVHIHLPAVIKGILVAVLALVPVAFMVWWHDPSSILPMSISTVVLGGLLGLFVEKYGK